MLIDPHWLVDHVQTCCVKICKQTMELYTICALQFADMESITRSEV